MSGWSRGDHFLSSGQFLWEQICVFRLGAVSDDQEQIVDRAWEWENVKRETFAQLSRKLSINAIQVEQNRALLFGCNEMLLCPIWQMIKTSFYGIGMNSEYLVDI